MKILTRKWLVQHNACSPALHAFSKLFPTNRMAFTKHNLRRILDYNTGEFAHYFAPPEMVTKEWLSDLLVTMLWADNVPFDDSDYDVYCRQWHQALNSSRLGQELLQYLRINVFAPHNELLMHPRGYPIFSLLPKERLINCILQTVKRLPGTTF